MTALTVREAYQIWKRDFRRGRLLDDYTDFNARFRDMAYATGLMPLPPGWKLPRWAMSVGMVLGGRGAPGYVLGHGASGAAATWWTAGGATNCVAAYQPKGAASLAASYINLANPGTYNAAPGVAPGWDAATGWIFADWQYLRTGIAVSGSYTWILRYGNFTIQQNRIPFGARISGLNGTWCEMGPTSGTTGYFVNGSATGFTTWGVSGVIGVSGSTAYRNGSAVGSTMTSANNTNTTYEAYIGALNNGGTPLSGYYFLGNISSVWIAATTLNAAQMATQSAAMP